MYLHFILEEQKNIAMKESHSNLELHLNGRIQSGSFREEKNNISRAHGHQGQEQFSAAQTRDWHLKYCLELNLI